MNNFKKSFKSKFFKIGGYSLVITLVVLVIAILLNMFVASLPANIIKPDITSNQLYSITDETKNIVSKIDEDITIYLVASTGNENSTILELLGRYTSANGKIKVNTIDPNNYPSFLKGYDATSANENSLIIESEKRYKVVDYSEIFKTEYSEEEYYYYYYYGQTPTGTTSFCGESEITSGILYVTDNDIPTIYTISGHGSGSFDSTMLGYFDDDNISVNELSLLTIESIPEDASAIALINPTSDLSDSEKNIVEDYLDNGGKILLFTSYETQDYTNLFSILEEYGAKANLGLVAEENDNYHLSGYSYFLLPKLQSTTVTSSISSSNLYVGMPYSHGITQMEELPDGITYTSLLKTSSAAYIIDVDETTTSIERTTEELGQFDIGVLLANSNNDSQILWYSSDSIISSDVDTYVSGGNSKVFLASISNFFEKSESVSIASKSMAVEQLTVSQAATTVIAGATIIVIPLGIIIFGLIYWNKRRKA